LFAWKRPPAAYSKLVNTTIAAARKQTLLSSMRHLLKLRGFKKRGATFHKPIGDVVHLISLQSSQSSSTVQTARSEDR